MFAPKDYLLLEWANVARTLRETLRYRYTENTTSDFYKECISRLRYVKHLIDGTDANDRSALHTLTIHLTRLSNLITAIERSHLEEFSWPFAYALQRTAKGVCRDSAANSSDALFFFRAEGGMISYEVRPEYSQPGLVGQKINSVVFPRTLKESVLLHAIIGHEIGHAAVAARQTALVAIVGSLITNSIVADPQRLFDWCAANYNTKEKVGDSYLAQQARSWAEEFFCDLFGLVMMGPAFIPAFVSLLEVVSFGGGSYYVPSHPPYGARVQALLHAARALKMLYSENAAPDNLMALTSSLDTSFVTNAAKYSDPVLGILDPSSINRAAIELTNFAAQFSELPFRPPDASLLGQLRKSIDIEIPPVGQYPAAAVGGETNQVAVPTECNVIDFRHILLAGWLSWSEAVGEKTEKQFSKINGLCAHAIMQQEGIAYWVERKSKAMGSP